MYSYIRLEIVTFIRGRVSIVLLDKVRQPLKQYINELHMVLLKSMHNIYNKH